MYVAVDVEGYQQNSVYARTPDGKMRLLGAHQEAIMGYVKLSPDGTKLAGFNESGRLQVADLDGRHVRTVATGVYSGTGHCEPVRWLTSRRLVYATGHDIRTINVDGTGGTRLTSRQNGCVPAISPDGRTVVSIDPPQKDVSPDGYGGGERLLVMSPTGSGQQVVPLPAAEQPLRIGQFSPDGRWFDAEIKLRSGSENGGIRLFDARTHRAISLPVTGRVNELSYLPDGGLVVQTCGLRWDSDSACSMVTLDRELKVTGQFRETKQMLGLGFIGITPRRP
jgi:WD40 repeat protein